MEYQEDQVPNNELQKNARLATDPAFRNEFDENIKQNNYSRILLKEFVKLVDSFGEIDTDTNTQLVYRIEPEGDGFIISKYEKPLEKLQSYEQAKPEFDRAVRKAKGKGRRKRRQVFPDGSVREGFVNSPFTIATKIRSLIWIFSLLICWLADKDLVYC